MDEAELVDEMDSLCDILELMYRPLRRADQQLIQIVDAALAETKQKSGEWLACRPGCTQCCFGPFPITRLDALRLRHGLKELEAADPVRALLVRERARESVARLSGDFPGDPETGILSEDHDGERRFEEFANDEPCPVLDPATGLCELYEFRPMTCRTFGPPVRSGADGALGVCDLCYHGATDQEIAACEMIPDPENLESKLIEKAEQTTRVRGQTIVAFCLSR